MRTVFLIGESIPLKQDGSEYTITPCGLLGSELEPFDARHGVFCNYVMTPLLATIHVLRQQQKETASLIDQLEPLLKDKGERRLNIFQRKKKEANEPFVIRQELSEFVRVTNPSETLCLLFGYQTVFGLLAWMLGGQQETTWTREKISEVAFAFLTAASTHTKIILNWPSPVELKPKTGHTGLIHRLCVENEGEGMLQQAVKTMAKPNVDKDSLVRFFRSAVPLLHNEAYRQGNIGNVQACFTQFATGQTDQAPTEQYWRVMGRAIACRLSDEFINR